MLESFLESTNVGMGWVFRLSQVIFLVSIVAMLTLKRKAKRLPEFEVCGVLPGNGERADIPVLIPCPEDKYDKSMKAWAILFILSMAGVAIHVFGFWLKWSVIATIAITLFSLLVAVAILFAGGFLQMVIRKDCH